MSVGKDGAFTKSGMAKQDVISFLRFVEDI